MIGVIVKNGTDIVGKPIYTGDDAKNLVLIQDFSNKNPQLTIEIHYDTDKDWATAFDQVQEKIVIKKDRTDWQTAKASGNAAVLTFIGRYLGLE